MVATRHQFSSRSADEQVWVQEWADVELVEQIELLEARVEQLKAERAELSSASQARARTVAASYALPSMPEDYLAGFLPVGAERPLEGDSVSITRGGLAVLAFFLLVSWAGIGLLVVWLLAL